MRPITNPNKLTVEIFRDEKTPDVTIDPVITALGGLSRIVDSFEIIRADRTIKVADESQTIDMHKIVWRRARADITVAMTDRPIYDYKKKVDVRGASFIMPDKYSRLGFREAIISSQGGATTEEVTEHEIGHILNVKSFGDKSDGEGHCLDEDCVMYYSTVPKVTQSSPEKLGEKIKATFGRFKAETMVSYDRRKLCAECAPQLGSSAFMLLEAKRGKFVPDSIVFPDRLRIFS